MKKKEMTMIKNIILTGLLMFSTSAFANIKVGYVDMQKAISLTKGGKKAFKQLKAFQESKQKELDKKKKSMEKEQADLEKKFAVYSDEKKIQAQKDFQKKAMEAEKYFRDSQMELAKKEKEMLEPVLKGLREAIATYAKKEGYEMIFEKTGSSLLFATEGSDLTSKVVKAYGK
jgi:outer membrane protein